MTLFEWFTDDSPSTTMQGRPGSSTRQDSPLSEAEAAQMAHNQQYTARIAAEIHAESARIRQAEERLYDLKRELQVALTGLEHGGWSEVPNAENELEPEAYDSCESATPNCSPALHFATEPHLQDDIPK